MRSFTSLVQRRCLVSAVVDTGRSETGTSGGATYFPKSHISLLPFGEPRKELHQHDLDLAMCQLRFRGFDNNYTRSRLETEGGPKGDFPRPATLAGGIPDSHKPFVLIGEFNVTPVVMQTTRFLSKANTPVVVAAEGQASYRSGRLLDDMIASDEILSALAQVSFTPAPWKAHDRKLKQDFWAGLWTRQGPIDESNGQKVSTDIAGLARGFEDRRTATQKHENPLPASEGNQLRRAACCLATDRGLDPDLWAPAELLMLEDSRFHLASVMTAAEARLAQPTQDLLNLIALLSQLMGGDRPTALTFLFYVLRSGILSPSIDPFVAKFEQFGDTAIKGSSVLRATRERRFFDELHMPEGDIALALYWDL